MHFSVCAGEARAILFILSCAVWHTGLNSTSFLASHSQSTGCHCVPLCLNALVLYREGDEEARVYLGSSGGRVHCVFCLFLLIEPPQEPITMRQVTVRAILAVTKWIILAIPELEPAWIVIALELSHNFVSRTGPRSFFLSLPLSGVTAHLPGYVLVDTGGWWSHCVWAAILQLFLFLKWCFIPSLSPHPVETLSVSPSLPKPMLSKNHLLTLEPARYLACFFSESASKASHPHLNQNDICHVYLWPVNSCH